VTELDPYIILGVARSAPRLEIARAYRALAKQHHPDAGALPSAVMARINDAWYTLSDPARRARWDREHASTTFVASPHWAPVPASQTHRPAARPQAPASRMDSGLMAAGIIAGVAVLVAVVMIGVSVAAAPPDERRQFTSDQLEFAYGPGWTLTPGDGTDPPGHQVIAHLVTFDVEPGELCASFTDSCDLTGGRIPPGEASIVITGWAEGTPPVPDPVVALPFGLDADDIIGGEPAATEIRQGEDGTTILWWQLSPPGFPDRWIEIRADIAGQNLEQDEVRAQIGAIIATIDFAD
jgi:hypothetical protein